jgi:hypothetical protein
MIMAIVAKCEPDLSDDDLEQFVDGDQPSLFFYESAASCLEATLSDDAAPPRAVRQSVVADDGEESDEDDDEQDDEEEEIDQPVRASVKPFLVQSLVLMVEAMKLDIEPAWQRTDVWSLKKKRELIKSLLLGIPLPSIILHSRGGRMSIIDGKQRLLSIIKFVGNEYKLPKYDVPADNPLYECRGVYYDKPGRASLSVETRQEFGLRELPALVFEDVSEKRLRGIFHLYNVTGTKLNAAEIRNAVYQTNPIYRVLYLLAGEGDGRADIGIGGLAVQEAFKKLLRSTYPGAHRRYQGVDFLARYLGYSRAAQSDPGKVFGTPSTSRAIDNYFDYRSHQEDATVVASEIVQVFNETPRFFDRDDDRLAFFVRASNGKRKFSKLAATTHMVATRMLLKLLALGVITEAAAYAACASLTLPVPEKQQSATIWDYQARVIIGLRDALGERALAQAGDEWAEFFRKMEYCILPSDDRPA